MKFWVNNNSIFLRVLKARSVMFFQSIAFSIISHGIENTGRSFRAHDLTYSIDPKLHLGLIQDAPTALFRSSTDLKDKVLIYSKTKITEGNSCNSIE